MRGKVIERPRSNQPTGYDPARHFNVRPYPRYCVKHNYMYYPFSWTDEATGRSYQKGYYDETGAYYENVVFRSEGKYKDVICKCEYCDTVSKIDWTEGGALICPQCGGTMQILSALDEYTQDPNYDKVRTHADYVDYSQRNRSLNKRNMLFIFSAVFLITMVLVMAFVNKTRSIGYYEGPAVVDPVDSDEDNIYLKNTAPGVSTVTFDGDYDRILYWDEDEQSYHEPDSDLWLWYNIEVDPPIWQYWYEPISGDYGDYGWMEWENGAWFIEAERDSWIRVPDGYDLSPLWHITLEGESNPAIFGSEIALTRNGEDSYQITDGESGDKLLRWDKDDQSYLDEDTGLRLWYNTDVEPPLWQYWYEPISGKYPGYGWMEYENGLWFIETARGNWITVPENNDLSGLWHLDAEAQ